MSFEYFVRPFQSVDAHGRTIIPAAPEGTVQRATLTWGAKADLQPFKQGSISVSTHWPDNYSDSPCCTEVSEQKGVPDYNQYTITNLGPSGGIISPVSRGSLVEMNKKTKNACGTASDGPPSALLAQFNASPASVLANYEREAAQMGVRTPKEERCKVQAQFV